MPVPAVARYLLTDIINLRNKGRWEKTAWEIDFTFVDTPITLAHRKFGVRVEIWSGSTDDKESTAALAARLINALGKAVAVFDRLVLLPAAEKALNAGSVTVANKQHQLREHFEYFRDHTRTCLDGQGHWKPRAAAPNPSNPTLQKIYEALEPRQRLYRERQEAFINATAAIHSYFSWLEHVLVLIAPFAGFDPESRSLSKLVRATWSDKFKTIFDVASDRRAKCAYDRLVELSERTRNTWAHGAFDKQDGLLHVHVDGVGAIPASVSEYHRNVHFGWLPGIGFDFDGAFATLNGVDEFLESSPLSAYGLVYVRAGLQVRFDRDARDEYANAMVSEESFERLIEVHSEIEDTIANMDW